MFDGILSATSLPNLHPAVVHFPIALLTTAFLVDLGCLVARRQIWLDRAATLLYVLGTVSACIAFVSGQSASQLVIGATGSAQAAMYDHESLAKLVLIAFGVIASLRLIVSWRLKKAKTLDTSPLRVITLLLTLAGQVLLLIAADRGGELVYRYGLGVVIEDVESQDELLEP